MRGADLAASRSRESDIGRPRACCNFLRARGERAMSPRADAPKQATSGHPARGRSFRAAAGLLARSFGVDSSLPSAKAAPVTSVGINSLLTVAGAAPELLHLSATHRLPIFATRPCGFV